MCSGAKLQLTSKTSLETTVCVIEIKSKLASDFFWHVVLPKSKVLVCCTCGDGISEKGRLEFY